MVMTGVLVLVGGLFDHGRFGGGGYKPQIDNQQAGVKQFHRRDPKQSPLGRELRPALPLTYL